MNLMHMLMLPLFNIRSALMPQKILSQRRPGLLEEVNNISAVIVMNLVTISKFIIIIFLFLLFIILSHWRLRAQCAYANVVYRKTCPRRASSGGEAAAIQPALTVDAAELFGVASSVAPALPVTSNGHVPLAITRVQPAKLEAALEAANKRVMAADKQVAASSTDAEFEEATTQLDCAVRLFEKVASCAHRCAVVAQSLSGGWDPSVSVERDHKRIRLESAPSGALTPSTMAMNEAATVAASDAVDAGTEEGGEVVVSGEAKEEPLE